MTDARRHDLDWLRIAAFGLLILYHVGMFYVSWPWHAKSAHAPVTSLEMPMRLIGGWRLPLLFVISGVALRFAFDKACGAAFPRFCRQNDVRTEDYRLCHLRFLPAPPRYEVTVKDQRGRQSMRRYRGSPGRRERSL